jgi:hypothetical protein
MKVRDRDYRLQRFMLMQTKLNDNRSMSGRVGQLQSPSRAAIGSACMAQDGPGAESLGYRHESPGMARFMKSSNMGTVKAVSP